jgi:hypothetical protein
LAAIGVDQPLTGWERFVFALGIGLSELSLLTLTLGLLGALRQPWWLAAVAAPAAAALVWRERCRRRFPAADHAAPPPGREPPDAAAGGLARHGLWWGLPFLLLILLGGMLPPVDFDVREYHLQVPKEWFAAGRIGFLEHNVYGNMPLGAEMHALLAMLLMPGERAWWWGALAGKTVIAAFAPLGALTLFAAGRRFVGRTAGTVAAVVYLSTPWTVHVAVHGLIDGVLAFYLLLATYAMLLWDGAVQEGSASSGKARRWLAVAGFAAGSAAACKYTGLLFAVAPLLAWAAWGRRLAPAQAAVAGGQTPGPAAAASRWAKPRRRLAAAGGWIDVRAAIMFLLAVACGCGLWLGKNWVLAGNPLYPLVFGGRTRTVEKDAQWNRAHRVPVDDRGRRYSFAQAAAAVQTVGWGSPWHSPVLVPLAALALVARGPRRPRWIVAALAGYVLVAWWLLTHRLDRFLVPLLPLIGLLCGIGAEWSMSRPWRISLGVLLGFGVVANGLLLEGTPGHDHRYLVSLEQLRRDEPVTPQGPSRVSVFHRYLNDSVPAGRRVLVVGEAAVFDIEVPVLYNTCFDDCLFERLLRGRDAAARRATLHAERISHVYINWSEINRYRSPGNYGFTDYVTPELVHGELVARQGILRKVELHADPQWGEVFEVAE